MPLRPMVSDCICVRKRLCTPIGRETRLRGVVVKVRLLPGASLHPDPLLRKEKEKGVEISSFMLERKKKR